MKKKQLIECSIGLVSFLALTIYSVIFWDDIPDPWYKEIAIIALICFFIHMVLVYSKYKSIFTFEFIFVVLNTVFCFGRPLLLLMGKEEYIFWDLMVDYSDHEKWTAGLLALLVNSGLINGFLLLPEKKAGILEGDDNKYSPVKLFRMGLYFFLLTEPITIYVAFKNISAINVSGGYSTASLNGVIGCLSYVACAGVIAMIASKRLSQRQSFVLLILYNVVSLVFATFTGDRRYVVTGILVTFIEYLYVYNKKIKPLKFAAYAIGGLFVILIINGIRHARAGAVVSLSSVISYIFSSDNSIGSIVYEALAEFGITFFTYSEAVKYYPAIVGFKYGLTYLLGPVTLIPGIGVVLPRISSMVSVPYPIEEILDYSVGGSLGEELYGNFGILAVPLSLAAGFIIVWIMRKRMRANTRSGYSVAKYYILFYFFINLVRATFNEMFRSCVWTFLIFAFLSLVIKERSRGCEE